MSALLLTDHYYPAGFAAGLVDAVIGFIEAAFVLRIILKLLAANPLSQFVALTYDITDRLLEPFAGALPVFVIGRNMALELSVILAMIGYSILGWLIIRLLHFMFLSPYLYGEGPERPAMPLRG